MRAVRTGRFSEAELCPKPYMPLRDSYSFPRAPAPIDFGSWAHKPARHRPSILTVKRGYHGGREADEHDILRSVACLAFLDPFR